MSNGVQSIAKAVKLNFPIPQVEPVNAMVRCAPHILFLLIFHRLRPTALDKVILDLLETH